MPLLINFEKHRLPRVLYIEERVDRGGLLNDWEVAFLEEAIGEAKRVRAAVGRHPEFQAVSAQAVRLYDEITVRALKNERQADQDTSER